MKDQGQVVPHSAFASEAEFRSFVREAGRLRDDAGPAPASGVRGPSEGVRPATDVAGIEARPHERGERVDAVHHRR
jgi:hypothetical protein